MCFSQQMCHHLVGGTLRYPGIHVRGREKVTWQEEPHQGQADRLTIGKHCKFRLNMDDHYSGHYSQQGPFGRASASR